MRINTIGKIYILTTIFILIFSFSHVFATDEIYVWSDQSTAVETSTNTTDTTTGTTENATGNFLGLTCGSAVLMEQTTGKILYEHNAHEQLRPASVTKIMSLLLIMEALDEGRISLTDKVPCSENAASMGGSQIWLDVREELTVNDMLKAIAVVSANDCVVAMAEYLSGSESAFVDLMNKRAKELGMNDTIFKNCHGIDEDGHLTSAYDIALMSQELMQKHPTITNYTTIWMDSLRDGKSNLVNTNKLIRTYKGVTGLKTGSTSLALYNLSATATREDFSLIAVIMKADTSAIRFVEAQKLLDYGYSTFTYKKFASAGEAAGVVTVNKGIEKEVNAVYASNSGALIKKGQEKNVKQDISLGENLTAPIKKGDIIGKVTYRIDDEVIGNQDIVAEKNVYRITIINSISYIMWKWFSLVR